MLVFKKNFSTYNPHRLLQQAELANQIDPLMLQVLSKCQQHRDQVKACQVGSSSSWHAQTRLCLAQCTAAIDLLHPTSPSASPAGGTVAPALLLGGPVE